MDLKIRETGEKVELNIYDCQSGQNWIADLMRSMESFKAGNARTPALSPRIPKMIQDAWMTASIDFQADSIRSGHIMLSL